MNNRYIIVGALSAFILSACSESSKSSANATSNMKLPGSGDASEMSSVEGSRDQIPASSNNLSLADANGDGKVDQNDLQAIVGANKFGTDVAATRAEGDFDGDGRVTIFDLTFLQSQMSEEEQFGLLSSSSNAVITTGGYVPGDVNKDYKVNKADLNMMLNSGKMYTGASATWSDGDFNGDGVVNILDVTILQTYMGKIAGDSNGDGLVNISDLVSIQSARKLDQDLDASWAEGDFNGDKRVTQADIEMAKVFYNKTN
jgi:hypothetical protein